MFEHFHKALPSLESNRLKLRKPVIADADDFYEVYNDRKMFIHTNSDIDISPDSFCLKMEHILNFLSSWENDYDLLCWGIELKETKKIIGRVYLYGFQGSQTAGYRANIGYSLSVKYQGNGYTSEAVKLIVDYSFSKLGIVRFQAEILPENTASIKVCEKNGFKNEGLLNNYVFYNNNGNCFKSIVMMALINPAL